METGLEHWYQDVTNGGNDHEPIKVIFLMGKTGVGKSTFISLVGGKNILENGAPPVVNHGSHSSTLESSAFGVKLDGKHIILIDTPGFDDASGNDEKNLHNILSCLHFFNHMSPKFELHGVIFLHDISEARFSGSQQKTYSLCQKLCGPEAMRNIIFGTTKWCMTSEEERNRQLDREQEILQDFCPDISRVNVCRLSSGDFNAAKGAVTQLLGGRPVKLLAQIEMEDHGFDDLPDKLVDIIGTTAVDYLLHRAPSSKKVRGGHKRERAFGRVKKLLSSPANLMHSVSVPDALLVSVPHALLGFPIKAITAFIRLFRSLRK